MQELFRVIATDGHRFLIFPNGEISGFPEGSIVVNFFPALLVQEIEAFKNCSRDGSGCGQHVEE